MSTTAGAHGGASLVVERVSKRFGGRINALTEASFAVEPGELVP